MTNHLSVAPRTSVLNGAAAVGAAFVIYSSAFAGANGPARAVVREGMTLDNGQTVSFSFGISLPAINNIGGWGFLVRGTPGPPHDHFYGNPTGGDGFIMRSQATLDGFDQQNFNSSWGMSNSGSIYYVATGMLLEGSSLLESNWIDNNFFTLENRHSPVPNRLWGSFDVAGMTATGTPFWRSRFRLNVNQQFIGTGIFKDVDETPVLLGGDSVPNLPFPLHEDGITQPQISANGVNYILRAYMDGAPVPTDEVIVISGQGVLIDGSLVRIGGTLPESAGGIPGETWQDFDSPGLDVTDNGEYIIIGRTSAAVSILFKNGQVLYRSGQMLDGVILNGLIEQAVMNENGDVAFVWNHSSGLQGLFVNDQLLISEGDPVDWDNDGVADPENTLFEIHDAASPAIRLTNRDANGIVHVYFAAEITRPGTFEAAGGFRMTVEIPLPFCPADLAGGSPSGPDGFVNVIDLFALLSNWNTAGLGADLAPPNNVVNVNDLFAMLGGWGPCE